jgi:short-subunit dehydrogenase
VNSADRRWRTVWITGGSSGIGRELSRLIGSEAQYVAISARSIDKLQGAAATHAAIYAHPLDVTDEDAVERCVQEIEAAAGPIDLAVLNAGAWTLMSVTDFDLRSVRTGVDVNYMGVMNCLDAVLPRMLDRGHGHIAIVASVAGYRGLPRSLAYGPTKAALINLAETLNAELAPRGITVSLVNPGFVDTPMTRENPFPMPGLMTPEDAAKKTLKGLKAGKFEIVFPTGFGLAMKLLRLLPDPLYFWFVRRFILKQPH